HQRAEPLAQTVRELADSETELLADVVLARFGEERHCLFGARRKDDAVRKELQLPTVATPETGRQRTRGDGGLAVINLGAHLHRGIGVQLKLRLAWPSPDEM